MGTKDEALSNASTTAVERLQRSLSQLGNIRPRKMFGGYGVFEEDTMFALVDSKGSVFFKVDDTNIKMYEEAGSPKHARMPYYRVPQAILNDDKTLQSWAQSSIAVSRNAK